MPGDRIHGADSEGRGVLLMFVREVIFDSILSNPDVSVRAESAGEE